MQHIRMGTQAESRTPACQILKNTIFLKPKESLRSSSTDQFFPKGMLPACLWVRVWVLWLVLYYRVTKHKWANTHTQTHSGWEKDQYRQCSGWEHRRPEKTFDIHFKPPTHPAKERALALWEKKAAIETQERHKKKYMRQTVMGGGCGVWWVGVWMEALKYEIRREVEKLLCCHRSKCKYPAHLSCYTTHGEIAHRTDTPMYMCLGYTG